MIYKDSGSCLLSTLTKENKMEKDAINHFKGQGSKPALQYIAPIIIELHSYLVEGACQDGSGAGGGDCAAMGVTAAGSCTGGEGPNASCDAGGVPTQTV